MDITLQAGIFLKSTAALNETFFAAATLIITEHNSQGAVGFVINRPFGRSLHELEEFRHSRLFPLYEGGPVDQEHLYFVHQRPDVIEDGAPAGHGIFFGGNFRQVITGINNKQLTTADVKIFAGYCGWDTGELEAEIAEGSWVISQASNNNVFVQNE